MQLKKMRRKNDKLKKEIKTRIVDDKRKKERKKEGKMVRRSVG